MEDVQIMLDLETLSTDIAFGSIIQIGACYFNWKTSEVLNTFFRNVSIESNFRHGRTVDAPTLEWWLSQSGEARKGIISVEKRIGLPEALDQLNWYLKTSTGIWSHATLDFVMVHRAMLVLGIKPYFDFRVSRDIRTIVDISGVNISSFGRGNLVHHNALDDCLFQVKYVSAALKDIFQIEPLVI